MNWRGVSLWVFSIWAVLAPWISFAQVQSARYPIAGVDAAGNAQTVEAALHQMSSRAGVIFVGTVRDVRRAKVTGIGSGVVEIRFDIEQAIRGCSGGSYTLREWGGLWSANDARYRVGQTLLLMLHAPGGTGLSSPVGGMDGAIPLRASGTGVRSSDASTGAAEPVADLRWIGAKLTRTVKYRVSGAPTLAMAQAASSSPAAGARSAVQAAAAKSIELTPPVALSDASIPAQEAAVSTVISMLRSWEVNSATR